VSSSGTDNEIAAQFLDDYFAECDEHLTVIRRDVLALEPLAEGTVVDRALVDELFRSLHTIKGLSCMVEGRPDQASPKRCSISKRPWRAPGANGPCCGRWPTCSWPTAPGF